MAFLEISQLRKQFGSHTVVHDFSLSAEKGEFITFLGPSGCGKTTILRMLAGFETPSQGRIVFDGQDVTTLRPQQRNIGMVFQAYALFPTMTVAQNIGFGLKLAHWPRARLEARVAEMLALIQLEALSQRYPWQLSGGQQQRVALARALAKQPRLLLLDEPLSALDAKIRLALREDIRSLQRQLGITTVFVTHDQEEALSVSDRIVVLNEGRVEQTGTPSAIYNFPRTRFVASFIGTLNQLQGQVEHAAQQLVRVGRQVLHCAALDSAATAGSACTLVIRPEAIRLAAPGDATGVPAQVQEVEFLGSIVRIRTALEGQRVSLDVFNDPRQTLPARDAWVRLQFAPQDLQLV